MSPRETKNLVPDATGGKRLACEACRALAALLAETLRDFTAAAIAMLYASACIGADVMIRDSWERLREQIAN